MKPDPSAAEALSCKECCACYVLCTLCLLSRQAGFHHLVRLFACSSILSLLKSFPDSALYTACKWSYALQLCYVNNSTTFSIAHQRLRSQRLTLALTTRLSHQCACFHLSCFVTFVSIQGSPRRFWNLGLLHVLAYNYPNLSASMAKMPVRAQVRNLCICTSHRMLGEHTGVHQGIDSRLPNGFIFPFSPL